ncbi:tetratricopeptide repeat protein [Rhodohalobacter mucosus]|uniref:Uncharacterized protein n=1 Tax=Rhodohalobacter mucosus TaxID=2079485 RepID=A0A316TWQ1_9BACT|nr:tetratricopeptide repeat protein [Rhodohalobacter mucosus]PWN06992.1 hypothetical protein DDZ15_06895 [Rhodohalobacter mucosus]
MTYIQTRKTIPVLTGIVFGLFFISSCAQLGITGNEPRQKGPATNAEISRQLDSINDLLSDNPDDAELQEQKADLLFTLSQNADDPLLRKPYYRNIRELHENSVQRGTESVDGVEEVISRAWSIEQASGVELLQSSRDAAETESVDRDRISAHFENAIILRPDSLSTYNLLANTYYLGGDLTSAIETLNTALQIPGSDNSELRERLAYLYLESGDIERSISLYRTLSEQYPEEDYIRHGLANALMLNNEHDEAISILRNLAEEYETRFEYREALAVQLYYRFSRSVEELQESANQPAAPGREQLSDLRGMAEEIDELLTGLQESLPLTEDQLYRSAVIFMNSSDRFNDLSVLAGEEYREELESLQAEYLQKAIPPLEKLAENHPENREYIQTLYDVYRDLGMDDEADTLERTYNL